MKHIILLVFFLIFYSEAFAKSFNLSEPIKVRANIENSSQALRSYFSDRPEFTYFEDQSLGAASSVFLYGLDQRYVEIKLNGFNVIDSSTPLGVLNLSQISGVSGLEVERFKASQAINLKTTSKNQKSKLLLKGSQLGEYGTNLSLVSKKMNFKVGASRAGGFNQTNIGSEKDWTEDQYASLDYETNLGLLKSETSLFFSRQEQDYDSVFTGVQDAVGESDFFLVGNKIEIKDYKLHLSYSMSNRVFTEDDEINKFKGESFQTELFYKKWLSVLFFTESNNDLDDQSVKFEVRPYENLRTSLMWSNLRDYFLDIEWFLIKDFSLFYKEIPASLFQINFDPEVELTPQRSIGLRFFQDFNIKDIDFRFDGLYQRAFDQIEFVVQDMAYQNFERSEVVFASLMMSYKDYSLYAQGQRAKNLVQDLDLPRRPRWVLGFDYQPSFKAVNIDLGLRWNSSLKAFDQSRLSSFWTSRLDIEYKSFHFVVMNVLNQDKPIFRDFKRRPTTLELQYSYEF